MSKELERDSQEAQDNLDPEEQHDRQHWVFSSRVDKAGKVRKRIFAHASAQYIHAEKHPTVAAGFFVVGPLLVLFFSCATSAPLMAQDSEQRAGTRARSTSAATTQAADAQAAQREAWRKSMVQVPLPKNGCFKASYPSTKWHEVQCMPPPQRWSLPGRRGGMGRPVADGVGDGFGDWSAQTAGLISSAEGSFISANGAANEQGGSPPTANAFELQLNSNVFMTPLCGGVVGCYGWQQFLFANNGTGAAVYIEYWLQERGSTCPPGQPWVNFSNSCVFDSTAMGVPVQTVADLAPLHLTLTATATAGGQDVAMVGTTSGDVYAKGQDSVLNLSGVWNIAEFNVFGPAGGTQAVFSNPTTFDVKTTINDGTMNAPSCLNATTTAETNNLNLVLCCPYGGATPRIEFMETNAGHTATCGATHILGDPHITTADGGHYDFQSAGEFVSLRDSGGVEIQTRQAPVSTTFIGTDGYDELTTCVSLNTAVAARVGEHRVTYQPNLSGVPDPSGLQLRIDGVLTALGPQGRDLGNGGRLFKSSTGGNLEIDFPDGKTLFVTPEWWASQSKWYLNVDVTRLGLVSQVGGSSPGGIAGPFANGSWLPALPGGASLGPMPASMQDRYTTLYRKFADAWRVTNKDSLFDYAPGTSTETFTLRDWPLEKAPCVVPDTKPVEPASEAVAEEACRRVWDTNMHSNCVFDVIATGNPGFAKIYLDTQRILADSTTISLTDDPDPSQAGEWVTFTAFVAADSTAATGFPSGTVQFAVDGSNAGGPVMVDAKGRARWETSRLKVGKHWVTASYVPGADSVFLPSTSLEKLHVVKRCHCEAADHED